MNWRDLFERALQTLRAVVDEASDDKCPPSIVEAYIQRHANSIVWLADEAKVLIDAGCTAAVPLIVRSMLESGFILAAAANEPSFAAEKMLRELFNLQKRITKHLGESELSSEFQTVEDAIREDSHFTGKPRQLTVKEVADIAELDVHYQLEYFLYSQHTHAEFGGLLARHYDENLPVRNLRTMAHVLIVAAGYTPTLLKTYTPQLHVDRAADLADELLTEIDASPQPPNADQP